MPWAGDGGLPGCQGKLPIHPELQFYAYKMGGRGEGGFPGNSNQIKSNVPSDVPLRGCYNLPPRGGVHEPLNYIQSHVGAAFSPAGNHSYFKGDDSPKWKLREPEHKIQDCFLPNKQPDKSGWHRARGGVRREWAQGGRREHPDPRWQPHQGGQTLEKPSYLHASKPAAGVEERNSGNTETAMRKGA